MQDPIPIEKILEVHIRKLTQPFKREHALKLALKGKLTKKEYKVLQA